jgi:hypothetical protein
LDEVSAESWPRVRNDLRQKKAERRFAPLLDLAKPKSLPAVAAVVATTIPAAISTTATAAATTSAASSPATATAAATTTAATATAASTVATTTAATTASTTAALRLWLGFVDYEIATAKILAVESVDGLLGVFVRGNFNETKTARLAGETVANEGYGRRSNSDLRKPFVKLIFCGGKREVTNIELLHLRTPSVRNRRASCGAR